MKLISFELSDIVKTKIEKALLKYGSNEIGGIIIGKKENNNDFIIVDISISDEDKVFSIFSFIRGTKKSKKLLKKHYSQKTGYYLGEWHSHPNFELKPSNKDKATMLNIINDSNYGVNFAVLLITKLVGKQLCYEGYFFHKDLKHIIQLSRRKPSV